MERDLKRKTNALLWATAVFTGSVLLSPDAYAMPGFARKYDSPCSSCHVAFPKLNEFGIAFKQRGYRMADEGPGEPVWKLPGIPVGGMAAVEYAFRDDETAEPERSSAAAVAEVEFFFGGVLGPNLSFFGDFGADVTAGESLTPDLAFLIFDDLVSDSRLNLKVGGFDVDFPFLSDPRSLTATGYLVRIAADGAEGVSLGRRGAEVNGYLPTMTRYAIGIGNAAALENDTNQLRAVHAWVAQSIELLGFDQTVGLLYSADRNGDTSVGTDDDTRAYGATLDLHYGLTGLVLGYFRYDGGMSEGDPEIRSGLAELLHAIRPELVGVARFDFQDDADSEAERRQYTVSLTYLFEPNVKTVAELSVLKDTDAGGDNLDATTALLAAVFGF